MSDNSEAGDGTLQIPPKKARKTSKNVKLKKNDTIAKSKQLVTKKCVIKQTKKTTNNKETRICGNGKPMPSLDELEKMFDDSSDEENSPKTTNSTNLNTYEKQFQSPRMLKKLAETSIVPPQTCNEHSKNKVHGMQTKGRNKENIQLGDRRLRKRKLLQPEFTERNKHNKTYKIDDVGTTIIIDEVEHIPAKCSKASEDTLGPISIFNLKSNKSLMLQDNEIVDTHSDCSVDSNKTVCYEYTAISPTNNRLRTFSPIPSTSKDNETFLKNDMRFNESLLQDDTQSEIEVIEIPCETIILDDDVNNEAPCIQIAESGVEESVPNRNDYFSTIKIDDSIDNNDCEIIDVDVVINENKALIEQYRQNDKNMTRTSAEKEMQVDDNERPIDNLHTEDSRPPDSQAATGEKERQVVNNETPIENVQAEGSRPKDAQAATGDKIGEVLRNFLAKPRNLEPTIPTENLSFAGLTKNIADCLFEFTQALVTSFSTRMSNRNRTPARNPPRNDNIVQIDLVSPEVFVHRNDVFVDDSVVFVPANVTDMRNNNRPVKPKKTNKQTTSQLTSTAGASGILQNRALNTDKEERRIGDCPICLENLCNSAVASTTCGHIFCMNCIQAAIKASGKRCPTCRKVLKGTAYHQLFL